MIDNTLNIDTLTGTGLEIAVTELLAREAEDVTELAKLRSKNDAIKTDYIAAKQKKKV